MTERRPYDYAILRVVPRVEREEFVNVGVVLFSKPREYLQCLFEEEATITRHVLALSYDFDAGLLHQHLLAVRAVCAGDRAAGPIARLSQSERFHWLTTPRSTAIQSSRQHGGLCADPPATLTWLFETLIARG